MSEATLTKKDFQSDQEVRWCPGCGDYAILAAMQKYMAEAGTDPAKTVFVSGIGCSSRFPYYMNTYGFHTIHGRAPAFATGIKATNPDLDVWLVTGDGDALSIGGNHLAHILRRNVNVNILMFNNEIYGLTKGQYSPTSPVGTRKKSTPMGSIDRPFNPLSFALGANATFVARTMDTDATHMAKIFQAASEHQGTSFVEILQNCVIFNKDFYSDKVDKKVRADKMIDLEAGKPMIFGKNNDKGLKVNGWDMDVVMADQADTWDPTMANPAGAFLMAQLSDQAEKPSPYGVFRAVKEGVYEVGVNAQVEQAIAKKGDGKIEDLVWAGERWTIGE
ncbi:MAG: 2-oxoacid:ferredoxin oxidoreductase subunit beta [Planctomycetota bacterium]|nr:2-oxoacid:ferredoxin oxidoreductase subunit beta [Planctomycetota bacterium]